MRGIKFLTIAAAGAIAMAGGAVAQSPADFYKGRQVTILHGFGVGGTYGKTSLSLAEALKPILGTDSIIVQNRTGSGGLKMTNYAYNVAPKDGSVLLMLPDTLVVTQLTRPEAAKYEADKFTFLGGAPQGQLRAGGARRHRREEMVRPQEQGSAHGLLGGRLPDLPGPGDRQRPAGDQDEDRQGLSRLAQDAAGDGTRARSPAST